MGTYYVYNFNFRTRYFFWFPTRHGSISLKTSTFFFFDVLMVEIILSAGQFFPERVDSVDHIAHVIGFSSGLLLALGLRFFQRWPSFLQTRGEFLYWDQVRRPKDFNPILSPLRTWFDILQLNAYNDRVKLNIFKTIYDHEASIPDNQIELAFRYLSPTFIRLFPEPVALVIQRLLARHRRIPLAWLAVTPYYSIILISKYLAKPPELQPLLFEFVASYRRAHPEGGDIDRKLELLMAKLSNLMPAEAKPIPLDGTRGTAI